VLKFPLKHFRGVLALWYDLQGALVLPETQKNNQTFAKYYPECMKKGEISSEGRRKVMDDEQPRISWENDLKYQME
jgi:hypothetical protein